MNNDKTNRSYIIIILIANWNKNNWKTGKIKQRRRKGEVAKQKVKANFKAPSGGIKQKRLTSLNL
jgi:hypothetical protein